MNSRQLPLRRLWRGGLALCLAWSNVVAFAPTATARAEAQPASTAEAQARADELRREIARADELYFKQAAPELTDAAYDDLKRELAAIELAYPEIGRGAAGQPAIGDDRTEGFAAARHGERMLSLRKSYTGAEWRAFHAQVAQRLGHDDVGYVVEPKFDGVAISVTYEHGRLVRAATRGNGDEGDDVTANARAIAALPRALQGEAASVPDRMELRGEVYLGWDEFRRLKAEQERAGEEPFAHPRNVAAGTLKSRDPAAVAQRRLSIVFYGLGLCEPATARPTSQQQLHQRIRAWGLPGVENVRVARGADEAWRAIEAVGRERGRYPFPTDGAVVKVDAVAEQQRLGVGPDAPAWAIAYKFAPDRAVTILRGITVQVGRTGVLTPVAELAPVTLKGTTIARASLHNFDEIRRRDLRVGDRVTVEKAGEIVPAIVGVDRTRRATDARPYEAPTHCPACGAAVVRLAGEVAVRCPNAGCPAQLRRRLAHFAGKSGVQIEGLGPAAIDALVETGALKTIADLYRLGPDDVARLRSGAGARVLASIERSRRAPLWRFVHGLGIPGVGPAGAKALARRFGGLAELAHAMPADYAGGGVTAAEAVPAATAASAQVFFGEAANRELVEALLAAGVQPQREDER